MIYYVIQSRAHPGDTMWINWENRRFYTLEEARAAFDALPIKADHRIAEAHAVIRYKPVKEV